MSKLLVDHYLDILKVFDEEKSGDLWVNKIVKAIEKNTSRRDKPAILQAINDLEKGGIIKPDPVSTRQQKQIKILTGIGKEIINFQNALTNCNINYTKLKEIIKENKFKIMDIEEGKDENEIKKIVKRKLSNKGWNPTEIENFDEIMRTSFRMENLYRRNIFNSILHRYSIILNKIKNNEIVQKIIRGIIIMEVEDILNIIEKKGNSSKKFLDSSFYFNGNEYEEFENIPFVELDKSVLKELYNYYSYYPISLVKKSISVLIEELTSSLLLLLQPNNEIIEEYINNLKQRVENKEESIILSKLINKEKYTNNEEVALSIDLAFIKWRNILLNIKAYRSLDNSILDNKV